MDSPDRVYAPGVQGYASTGQGLSLMDKRLLLTRLPWFTGLWVGCAMAFSIIGMIIKLWLNP